MQIIYIYFLSPKHTHSNVSLPCFLNFIYLRVCSILVHKECPYSILWLHHGLWYGYPWSVFKIGVYWLRETFPVVLAKFIVHMAWPGAAEGRMPIQRLGGTAGPDYEWDWPGQIWVTKAKNRAGEPHARWRSPAKGHLWPICHSPDGPHLKQRHWPSFMLGWENVSAEAQREDQVFLTLSGKRLRSVRGQVIS